MAEHRASLKSDANPPRFLSVRDSASYSGLSRETIRRMLQSGKLTPYRPVPGRIVVDRQQLDSVILASAETQE